MPILRCSANTPNWIIFVIYNVELCPFIINTQIIIVTHIRTCNHFHEIISWHYPSNKGWRYVLFSWPIHSKLWSNVIRWLLWNSPKDLQYSWKRTDCSFVLMHLAQLLHQRTICKVLVLWDPPSEGIFPSRLFVQMHCTSHFWSN